MWKHTIMTVVPSHFHQKYVEEDFEDSRGRRSDATFAVSLFGEARLQKLGPALVTLSTL